MKQAWCKLVGHDWLYKPTKQEHRAHKQCQRCSKQDEIYRPKAKASKV